MTHIKKASKLAYNALGVAIFGGALILLMALPVVLVVEHCRVWH